MNKPQTKKPHPKNKHGNTQMGQAMERMVTKVKKNYQPPVHQPVAVNRLQKDGVDHINIHPHARTKLGEALSTVGNIEFRHPQYGTFNNIIGLEMWLCSTDQPDRFRRMAGRELLKLRRTLTDRVRISNYRHVVLTSTWMKIKSSPALMEDIKRCALSFDYYYYERVEMGEPIRVRAVEYDWLCPAMEEMRKALLEEREPDFIPYLTNAEIIQQRTAAESAARNLGPVFEESVKEQTTKRKQPKPKKVNEQKRGDASAVQSLDEAPYAHLQTAVVLPPTEISDCAVVDYRTLPNPLTGKPYGDLSTTKIDGSPMYDENGKVIPFGLVIPKDEEKSQEVTALGAEQTKEGVTTSVEPEKPVIDLVQESTIVPAEVADQAQAENAQ